jgi:hypothetical protein
MTTSEVDVKATLFDFQGGQVSQSMTMKRLGLDWYGDLLSLMGQYGIAPPLGGKYESVGAIALAHRLIAEAQECQGE